MRSAKKFWIDSTILWDSLRCVKMLHPVDWWFALRQCSGEKSIFFNNATNELLFGRKHCFYDLNIKMVHFCTFIMRLLWKLGKIAAILDSRRRKKRSQFWIFCYQIFNISKKLQYLQTYQRDFWNFEKKSIFLIFCQKWHKNMRFFIVFRISFRNLTF